MSNYKKHTEFMLNLVISGFYGYYFCGFLLSSIFAWISVNVCSSTPCDNFRIKMILIPLAGVFIVSFFFGLFFKILNGKYLFASYCFYLVFLFKLFYDVSIFDMFNLVWYMVLSSVSFIFPTFMSFVSHQKNFTENHSQVIHDTSFQLKFEEYECHTPDSRLLKYKKPFGFIRFIGKERCPYCGSLAISTFEKISLGHPVSIKCKKCGKNLTMRWYFLLMTCILACLFSSLSFIFVISFDFFEDIIFSLLMAALLLLFYKFIPLIPKE